MTPPPGSTVLSEPDMIRIHRRVVLVGAAASWFAAAIFIVAGFFTSNETFYLQALGPVLAAGLMTALVVLRRENGGIALFGSAVVVVVMYGVLPAEGMLLPASLSLVVICSLGMLFVTKRLIPVAVATGLALGVVPQIWGLSGSVRFQTGLIMTLSFSMTTVILVTLRNAATALNLKFRAMFERSPSALSEEDWSGTMAFIRSEYTDHSGGFREFLTANPALVRRAVGYAIVTRVNQAAVDLLGASSYAEILGPRDSSAVTSRNVDGFMEILVNLYDQVPEFETELPMETRRGQETRLHTRFVTNAGTAGPDTVLVAFADVTPAREREDALADLVRAKDRFIASISHELRTPLTAVVGLASEMATTSMESEELSELLGLVSGQAVEMSHIVEDLLVAARAEIGTVSMEITDVDLNEELAAVLGGIDVAMAACPDELPWVRADATRLRQIFRNLLTNVTRYGGPVCRLVSGEAEGVAWVEVRDNGPGVSPEDSEKIFEPYVTAHSGKSGSVGLGLSVARQLAVMMGGSLVYRRDGDESVFRLELPALRAHATV